MTEPRPPTPLDSIELTLDELRRLARHAFFMGMKDHAADLRSIANAVQSDVHKLRLAEARRRQANAQLPRVFRGAL